MALCGGKCWLPCEKTCYLVVGSCNACCYCGTAWYGVSFSCKLWYFILSKGAVVRCDMGFPHFFCVLHATFVSRIGMDVLRVLPFQVAFFGGHVFFFFTASPSTAILLLQSESFFFSTRSIHTFWTKPRQFFQSQPRFQSKFSLFQLLILSPIFSSMFSRTTYFFHRTLPFFLSQIKHWITVSRSIGINFVFHSVFLRSFFVSFHQRHLCNQNPLKTPSDEAGRRLGQFLFKHFFNINYI